VADKVRVAVVIRIDSFAKGADDSAVTVVSVFFDLDDARSEAQRLNELNGSKGMRYFAQVSRLYPEGRSSSMNLGQA
jgi:hypothetical protein